MFGWFKRKRKPQHITVSTVLGSHACICFYSKHARFKPDFFIYITEGSNRVVGSYWGMNHVTGSPTFKVRIPKKGDRTRIRVYSILHALFKKNGFKDHLNALDLVFGHTVVIDRKALWLPEIDELCRARLKAWLASYDKA